MKIASQTASTQGQTFKNNGFKMFQNDRNRSKDKIDDNPESLIDFSKFQRQMNKFQQKIIRQEIQKYENINLQKQFPPLLKQLKQKSQKLITLENKLNTIKEQYSKKQIQGQKLQQSLEQEKQALQQELFNLQCDDLLKQQYEKQLILGMIDNFEGKIKQLMEEKEEKMEQKSIVMQQRNQLLDQIEKEKQIIMKLAVAKGKILQELDFVKNCQIEPIHLIREKSLKSYQEKVKYFESRFIGNESSQGLIANYCQKYENLTQKQLGQMVCTQENQCVQELLVQQQKIQSLQKNLNNLTSSKLKKTQQINIELNKKKLLNRQIDQKNQEIQKYQQLLTFVQNQSYCIEQVQDNGSIGKQVVTNLQLEQIVNNEINENKLLKERLKQLIEKLNIQKEKNQNLNRLLIQAKNDHQMRTNKMIAETNVLKSNLEIKKKIYEDKIDVRQHVIDSQSFRLKSEEQVKMKHFIPQAKMFDSYKRQPTLFEEMRKNHMAKGVRQEENMQSKLTELRSRLMKKFQAAEHVKK